MNTLFCSGMATGGRGVVECPSWQRKICQKSGGKKKKKKKKKKQENEEKSRIKGKNRYTSFTLPLLTDRAGYATAALALDMF